MSGKRKRKEEKGRGTDGLCRGLVLLLLFAFSYSTPKGKAADLNADPLARSLVLNPDEEEDWYTGTKLYIGKTCEKIDTLMNSLIEPNESNQTSLTFPRSSSLGCHSWG